MCKHCWELAGLAETWSEETRNLLNQTVRCQECIITLGWGERKREGEGESGGEREREGGGREREGGGREREGGGREREGWEGESGGEREGKGLQQSCNRPRIDFRTCM